MSFLKRLFSRKSPEPQTNLTATIGERKRSGSFSGELNLVEQGNRSKTHGYVKFQYSHTHKDLFVDTIVSQVSGGGRKLHQGLEDIARHQSEATRMVTATSRPGYFMKMGYDYSGPQQQINQRKYTQQQLQVQEQNRSEGGGGFEMEKMIVRRKSSQL